MTTMEAGAPFGPYVIEGFVAGGGMGRVYAASHSVYGHPVALKILHERFAQDPRWHKRFSEEGLVGLQLKHPHVLSARELVEHDGQIALAMDLVRGGQTLLSVIERERPSGLPLSEALPVFLRILSGVEYLHDRGVVHGDLKPENVLIDGQLRDPSTWKPQVTDFGTVALIADPIQIDGKAAVVASPRYASPEHLKGSDHLEFRSDIHGLGLLLYWLISGEHPSGARTVEQAAQTLQTPLSLLHVVDQPEPLLQILREATAIKPEDRHTDCRALAMAIRGILDELGLGLQLEDLQSELATEILEEQARAQKALQDGGPAPSPDDTEIELEDFDDNDASGEPPPIAGSASSAASQTVPSDVPDLAPAEPTSDESADAMTDAPEDVRDHAPEDAPEEDVDVADTAPTEIPAPLPREPVDDTPTVDDAPTMEAPAFVKEMLATPEPATPKDSPTESENDPAPTSLIAPLLIAGAVLGVLTVVGAWALGWLG
ncbi:MAG: serine/threonine protein kinase [Myxococcota bacterium]